MIVREILNKDFDMKTFDHYNDSKDTLLWLRGMALTYKESTTNAQDKHDELLKCISDIKSTINTTLEARAK